MSLNWPLPRLDPRIFWGLLQWASAVLLRCCSGTTPQKPEREWSGAKGMSLKRNAEILLPLTGWGRVGAIDSRAERWERDGTGTGKKRQT